MERGLDTSIMPPLFEADASGRFANELFQSRRDVVLRPRTLDLSSGESNSYMKYDEHGQPCEYKNHRGEVFKRQAGEWKSTTNIIQTGVEISIDKSKNVTVTDRDSKVATTESKDGVVTKRYECGTVTTRRSECGVERLTIDNAGQSKRYLTFKNNELVEYIDKVGDTYSNASGRWTKTDCYGRTLPFNGSVRAVDNAGTVRIVDENFKNTKQHRLTHTLDGQVADKPNQVCKIEQQTPQHADLLLNMSVAERHRASGPFTMVFELGPWFRGQVKNKAPWDYKQGGCQYEDFGNFNYGAVGAAAGISLDCLLKEAGYAQEQAGTSRPEWGHSGMRIMGVRITSSGGTGSYGDDPHDQELIKRGYEYYQRTKGR